MQPTLESVDIRDWLQPGDIEAISRLHAGLYAAEYRYGAGFEAAVADGLADFVHRFEATRDRVWICENDGEVIGSLFLAHRDGGAQLRFFLLDPDHRGLGLGELLMTQFMHALEECGYRYAFLWTTHELEAAASLYRRHGFVLVEEVWSTRFGKGLFERKYEWVGG